MPVGGFNPTRFAVARERRGFSKTALASVLSLSVRMIGKYESGDAVPSPETMDHIVSILQFPVEFFEGTDLDELPIGAASFRALSTITARKATQAQAAGRMALALSDWIDERFTLPSSDVERMRGLTPELAAKMIREQWGLGEQPAPNMVHLLEQHGVRVFSLAEDHVEVDAFSLWRDKVPYVFLNTMKTAEHGRMDCAHELGHLVLHGHHDQPRGRDLEQEANAFGRAFLMPRRSVLARAPRNATVDDLIRAKRFWNVSVLLLAYRMHELGVLTDWQYRTVCIQSSKLGYRKSEPNESQRETSQILTKVFAALRQEGVTKSTVATDLRIHQKDLDELIFGLVLTRVEGGGEVTTSTDRPALRLINGTERPRMIRAESYGHTLLS